MTVADVTGLITALTALAIAIGGVLTAIKVLHEVRTGNALTQAGNDLTGEVHLQLNSAKTASDRYEQDLRRALQVAGVAIPDNESLEATPDAVPEKEEWR